MSTVSDVVKKIGVHTVLRILVGGNSPFDLECQMRVRKIGIIICQENQVLWNTDEARRIPLTTPLGSKSQTLFDDFCRWFEEKTK